MNAFLTFIPGASAGALGVFFMRYKELSDGISIQNYAGDENYGMSKVAAKKAILQTAFTRANIAMYVIFGPAFVKVLMMQLRMWPKSNTVAGMIELFLCGLSLTFGLPLGVALFKQRASLA